MKKSIKRKPGRPTTTGKTPFVGIRLPREMIQAVDIRAAAEGITRSATIRRLIELGLTVPIDRRRRGGEAAAREARDTDAERAAHDYIDNALKHEHEDVRAARKKQLTTMPSGAKRR